MRFIHGIVAGTTLSMLLGCASPRFALTAREGADDCLWRLAPGDRVDLSNMADPVVIGADGSRRSLGPCTPPHKPSTSGWIVNMNWPANPLQPVGSMTASFMVPTDPLHGDGATLFFFPGGQIAMPYMIWQTVLHYGYDAWKGWSIASWLDNRAGWSFQSTPLPTKAGDTIFGSITSSCSNNVCNWCLMTIDCSTADCSHTPDCTTKEASAFVIENLDPNFTPQQFFGGAFEGYAVTDCQTQYPAGSKSITFSNITLKDRNGDPIQTMWFKGLINPDCGATAVSPDGKTVTLMWPGQ